LLLAIFEDTSFSVLLLGQVWV